MRKNPWPTAIIAYFALFISAMVYWIAFAVRNDHELVRPDYYEQELRFQEEIDQANRGVGVAVRVEHDPARQTVTVHLPVKPDGGVVQFYRPSHSSLDQTVPLSLVEGKQVIDVRAFRPGLWRLRLIWSAGGATHLRGATLALGRPPSGDENRAEKL